MMTILLIKSIYLFRIQMKQNVNISLKNVKKIGLEYHQNPKAYTEYSNNMQDVYKNKNKLKTYFQIIR